MLIIPKLWKDFFKDDKDFEGQRETIELFEPSVCWNFKNPPLLWNWLRIS